jgi:hypothetical protein
MVPSIREDREVPEVDENSTPAFRKHSYYIPGDALYSWIASPLMNYT